MNDLEIFFHSNLGRMMHKWRHYFDIYDHHFARFRGAEVNILEFGVNHGGQMMNHQINTFNVFFEKVKDGGVYLCEDTHTSYWKRFGGGYRNNHSFIEFKKKLWMICTLFILNQ